MKLIRKIGPLQMEAIKITALGGLFWFAWSFVIYQPVYLQQIGFTASDLGLMNALAAGVSIFSVAFWGMVSDRSSSPKRILFFVLLIGSLLYASIPLIPTDLRYSTILFFVLIPLFNFFRGPTITLIENLQVRNCNELRLNYGFTRSIGSFLFTVGSIVIAFILRYIDLRYSFFLALLVMIPVMILSLFVRNPSARSAGKHPSSAQSKKEPINLRALFKNRSYVYFLLFALLFYMPFNCVGAFMPFYMSEIGAGSENIGLFLAYRALLEIPFLLLMNKLRQKFSYPQMLMAGICLIMLESLLLTFYADSFFKMLVSTTLFGLGNGLFIGSSLNYLYQLAPSNLKASAQSFFAATASTAGIIGNLIGGLLFDRVGARMFYFGIFFFFLLSAIVFFITQILPARKQSVDSDLTV